MYNAAERATPPKANKKKPDYYQPDELNKIIRALDTAPLKWKTITYILIDTGCRRGEAMGLKWDSIDLCCCSSIRMSKLTCCRYKIDSIRDHCRSYGVPEGMGMYMRQIMFF